VASTVQMARPIGDGLLPADFGAGLRQDLANGLAMAYSAVQQTNLGNHRLWQSLLEDELPRLRRLYEELGLEAPPLAWDALWARVALPVPALNAVQHSQLVVALATDYAPRLCEHIWYRHANKGNVHIRSRGPTGSGKSSCMIALMHWTKPLPEGRLTEHLAFDVHELPRKLSGIAAGHGVLLDELVATAGEGARTARMMLENLEDTMRASERDLYVASPGKSEHSTMQVELECIAWHPTRRFSVFLCWVEGIPLGVAAIPWCNEQQYAEYAPWKQDKVQRSLAGQFNDNAQTAKAVMQLFADDRFVEYLWLGVNKPKMGDFNTATVLFYPSMLTQAQVDRMAKFAYETCYSYQRLESRFEFFFGVKPNKGFQKIASKCYEE
jgi:hypothetical protein